MDRLAALRLLLVTQEGQPLNEEVEIHLRSGAGGDPRVVRETVAGPIVLEGLTSAPGTECTVEVLPTTFRRETRTFKILAGAPTEIIIVFCHCDDDDRHCPPLKVADQLDEKAVTTHLVARLAGTPADGTAAPARNLNQVIWIDNGNEVLVHLDSLRTVILEGMILVSLDLESDQTGRTTMVVPFAVGKQGDPAGLIAVTEEFPRGNGVLASRWGNALQAAAWSSLLSLAADHATERFSAPLGIAAQKGLLSLQAGAPLRVTGVTR